jgi:Na+-driven multidrug efflux pump
LSKLWIANIDSSLLSTADAYTYFTVVIEVLNEGLPRAAWSTIGSGDTTRDTTEELLRRLSLTYTLISIQTFFGFILSIIFLFAAPGFVRAFVPGKARAVSVKYIRILAFDSLASTLNTAVSLGTRALDKPDVPLLMSSVQTLIQIFLELALISFVHVKGVTPTLHVQATIKLVCDLTGAAVGLVYFLYLARKAVSRSEAGATRLKWFSYESLKVLVRPGRWTFLESLVRNAIYLWQVHGVVSMGQSYTTAWGVFNTIRWGLIMVPVQALEATSNTFVGHRWGIYQQSKPFPDTRASWGDLKFVTAPAFKSVVIALLVECPLCLALSIKGAGPFAKYLSNSDEVAAITAMMWRSIDWCYICYGVSTQLATILLSTQTKWYLYQSLVSNIFYCLPWAIALPRIGITASTAWRYHKWVFGGSLVVSLGIIIFVDALWALRLRGWRVSRKKGFWRSRVEV